MDLLPVGGVSLVICRFNFYRYFYSKLCYQKRANQWTSSLLGGGGGGGGVSLVICRFNYYRYFNIVAFAWHWL